MRVRFARSCRVDAEHEWQMIVIMHTPVNVFLSSTRFREGLRRACRHEVCVCDGAVVGSQRVSYDGCELHILLR
jgi:hypothetical protein